jgi:hypothetical protein
MLTLFWSTHFGKDNICEACNDVWYCNVGFHVVVSRQWKCLHSFSENENDTPAKQLLIQEVWAKVQDQYLSDKSCHFTNTLMQNDPSKLDYKHFQMMAKTMYILSISD